MSDVMALTLPARPAAAQSPSGTPGFRPATTARRLSPEGSRTRVADRVQVLFRKYRGPGRRVRPGPRFPQETNAELADHDRPTRRRAVARRAGAGRHLHRVGAALEAVPALRAAGQ